MKTFSVVFKDGHSFTVDEKQAANIKQIWREGKFKVFEFKDSMYSFSHIARIWKIKDSQNVMTEEENQRFLPEKTILRINKPKNV